MSTLAIKETLRHSGFTTVRLIPKGNVMTGASVPFRKMNGLGNDFVVLDARATKLAVTPEAVRRIADRKAGIGCDTVIVLEPSRSAELFMRIFNADGSESEACGNANRCVAMLIASTQGITSPTIETRAGVLATKVHGDGSVTVDMGVPKFDWQDIPLSEPFHNTRMIELQIGPIDAPVLHSPSVVNVGNPHCVFWVDDVAAHALDRFGPILENHPVFPDRANISLVQVVDRSHLIQRVWERGVGLTQACGTGACAATVCAVRKGFTERTVRVTLPGGDLMIDWRADDHIMMTGPAVLDYEGMLSLA
jgi:diaminopimelate epimerase